MLSFCYLQILQSPFWIIVTCWLALNRKEKEKKKKKTLNKCSFDFTKYIYLFIERVDRSCSSRNSGEFVRSYRKGFDFVVVDQPIESRHSYRAAVWWREFLDNADERLEYMLTHSKYHTNNQYLQLVIFVQQIVICWHDPVSQTKNQISTLRMNENPRFIHHV